MSEPSLLLQDDFVADPDALYDALTFGVAWDERLRARKTASFGEAYNYSGMTYPVTPMHPLLISVVDRLQQTLGSRPNNCLLNFYPDGDSTMGFHSDATDELVPGTGVAVVSLGAERSITFRSKDDVPESYDCRLKGGSLLYMSQDVQKDWKHAILKQAETGGRISLTFRLLEPHAMQPR